MTHHANGVRGARRRFFVQGEAVGAGSGTYGVGAGTGVGVTVGVGAGVARRLRPLLMLNGGAVRAGVGVYAEAGASPVSANGNGMRIDQRSREVVDLRLGRRDDLRSGRERRDDRLGRAHGHQSGVDLEALDDVDAPARPVGRRRPPTTSSARVPAGARTAPSSIEAVAEVERDDRRLRDGPRRAGRPSRRRPPFPSAAHAAAAPRRSPTLPSGEGRPRR